MATLYDQWKTAEPQECLDTVYTECHLDGFQVSACCDLTTYLEGMVEVAIHEGNDVELFGAENLRLVRCTDNGDEVDSMPARLAEYESMIVEQVKAELRKWSRFEFEDDDMRVGRDL